MLDVVGDSLEGQQRDCCVQLEGTDADQDEPQPRIKASPLRGCGMMSEDTGDNRGLKEDERMQDSAGDATSAWSSLELDMNFDSTSKGQNCTLNNSATMFFFPFVSIVN